MIQRPTNVGSSTENVIDGEPFGVLTGPIKGGDHNEDTYGIGRSAAILMLIAGLLPANADAVFLMKQRANLDPKSHARDIT